MSRAAPGPYLAAEAIAAYVAREAEVIAGIERGLDDMRSGLLVPHDQAMARLETTVVSTEMQQVASVHRDC